MYSFADYVVAHCSTSTGSRHSRTVPDWSRLQSEESSDSVGDQGRHGLWWDFARGTIEYGLREHRQEIFRDIYVVEVVRVFLVVHLCFEFDVCFVLISIFLQSRSLELTHMTGEPIMGADEMHNLFCGNISKVVFLYLGPESRNLHEKIFVVTVELGSPRLVVATTEVD